MNKETKTPRQEFGETLLAMRKKSGFTQMDVSEIAGFSTAQYVSNVERGLCAVSLKTVVILAALYNADKARLLGYFAKVQTERTMQKARAIKLDKKTLEKIRVRRAKRATVTG